jgi:response regulator NasT
MEMAIGRHRELLALSDSVRGLEEQLETRKLVERAKGELMDHHDMSEAEAFSFIQRRAMGERTTMKVVAERVLAGELP